MPSLVGKRVKYIGDVDDIFLHGLEQRAHQLWNDVGVVQSHTNTETNYCVVAYKGQFLTDLYALRTELLRVVG